MNLDYAERKLHDAYKKACDYSQCNCSSQTKKLIDFVIDNTHLTYKYILFTALLAKASDSSINVLCLQKQSSLIGAYDARSLCHKVIVPFEMQTLHKALGGSNEPFLNKPARFPELSKTNAVRKGNDQKILFYLCDNLPRINSSGEAFDGLVYLLHKLILLRNQKAKMMNFSLKTSINSPACLFDFIETFLEQSFEGESLTLAVAGVYHLLYNSEDSIVEVHPVNQSGASGREVSDLDVYVANHLVSSNELKDKTFAETDVRHAADKVIEAGGNKLLFITGPRANDYIGFKSKIEKEYKNKGFFLHIISYQDFLSSIVGVLKEINIQDFLLFIIKTAHETKFKEELVAYLYSLAKQKLGLSFND